MCLCVDGSVGMMYCTVVVRVVRCNRELVSRTIMWSLPNVDVLTVLSTPQHSFEVRAGKEFERGLVLEGNQFLGFSRKIQFRALFQVFFMVLGCS